MTSPREHLTTWIGLAVGLGLAWTGWEWWLTWYEAQVLYEPEAIGRHTGIRTVYELKSIPVPGTLPPSWAQPAIIAGLVIVVLLCTVAGALIGNRMRAGVRSGCC